MKLPEGWHRRKQALCKWHLSRPQHLLRCTKCNTGREVFEVFDMETGAIAPSVAPCTAHGCDGLCVRHGEIPESCRAETLC